MILFVLIQKISLNLKFQKVLNRKIFNTFEDCVKYYGHKKLICDIIFDDEGIKKYKSFKIVALKLKWILMNENS